MSAITAAEREKRICDRAEPIQHPDRLQAAAAVFRGAELDTHSVDIVMTTAAGEARVYTGNNRNQSHSAYQLLSSSGNSAWVLLPTTLQAAVVSVGGQSQQTNADCRQYFKVFKALLSSFFGKGQPHDAL